MSTPRPRRPRAQRPGPQRPGPQYPIESVDNALRLLLLFSERPRIRLTDASNYLGVASSTAHRLLAMLYYHGFVQQDPMSKAYVPGPALGRIAAATTRQVDVRSLVRPVLERLNVELGETVHLGRVDGAKVRFLDSIESPKAVRVASRTNLEMPAHCTSTGKAVLSQLDDEQIEALYPRTTLPAMTPRSIATRDDLLRELAAVRRRGFATSNQESEDGVCSVAVALVNQGDARYALNVSVPVSRMTVARRSEIAAALNRAVGELAAWLA